MADLSSLTGLLDAEPIDLPQYKQSQEFRLPKKGRYIVRAPESFAPTTFGATKAGYLSAQVDPVIVGPSNEGFTCRYTKVSAKSWTDQRTGATTSQLGRYLKACGLNSTIGATAQEQADAVEQTAGAMYQIVGDWKAYNKNTGFEVKGMENFPSDGNGGHQQWIEDPTERDENGEPVRLRANFVVVRFLSMPSA
jgi:hypothetical protein